MARLTANGWINSILAVLCLGVVTASYYYKRAWHEAGECIYFEPKKETIRITANAESYEGEIISPHDGGVGRESFAFEVLNRWGVKIECPRSEQDDKGPA